MTTEELIQRKRELGYTNEMIAARSGVPLATVQKVFSGTTKSPRYNTRKALEQALGGFPEPAGGSAETSQAACDDVPKSAGGGNLPLQAASKNAPKSIAGGSASPSPGPAANYRYDTETISAAAAEAGFLREPLPAYKVKTEAEIRQNRIDKTRYLSACTQPNDAQAVDTPAVDIRATDTLAVSTPAVDAQPNGVQTIGARADDTQAGSAQEDDIRTSNVQTGGTRAAGEWNRQGEYTLDDYLALPPEQRVELIDGVFYDMAAPGSAHQILALSLCMKLDAYITANHCSCLPMISPLDVRLDSDDKTVVQPDVIVICDREKITRAGITGAPDLVIEVLSASTRKKDMFIKLNKYLNAGVREYWMVDPDRQQILVYDFAHEQYPLFFTFKDQVPVGLFKGACQIDFAELFEQIRFLYPEEPTE